MPGPAKDAASFGRLFDSSRYSVGDKAFFEDASARRRPSINRFTRGDILFPRYDYPRMQPASASFQRLLQKRAHLQSILAVIPSDTPEPEKTMLIQSLSRSLAISELVIGASALNGYRPLGIGVKEGLRLFETAGLSVYGPPDVELFKKALGYFLHDLYSGSGRRTAAVRSLKTLHNLIAAGETYQNVRFMPNEQTIGRLKKYVAEEYGPALRYVTRTNGETYNSWECREIFNLILAQYGLASYGWTTVRTATNTLWGVNPFRKQIRIPLHALVTADALKRYIIHEFGVHAMRSFRGSQHAGLPSLAHGLPPDSIEADEGLGILLESLVDDNPQPEALNRAVERYVAYGLSIGLDGKPRNARELFDILRQMYKTRLLSDPLVYGNIEYLSADMAYKYVENLFRGTTFTARGVVYPRSKLYLEGLVNMSAYFETNSSRQAFDQVLEGKFDPTNKLHQQLLAKYSL